jgi:hypothetical protein
MWSYLLIYNKTTSVNKHIRIMMFIKPTNVLRIQEELKEYQRLFAEFKHSPAKEEFEDIVNFILTQSGSATGALSESISEKDMSYLFESFKEKLEPLFEAHVETDGEAEFDTAVGAVTSVAKKAGAAIVVGAATAGLYIAFLLKKGKIKGSIAKENSLEMKKIDKFQDIVDLKVELAKLKGEAIPSFSNMPTMTPAPEMEAPKKPGEE